MKEIRPRLNPEEWDIIQEYRAKHKGLTGECEAVGIPIENVKHYWYKGEHYSINVKGQEVSYLDIKDAIIADMKAHAPKYTPH